MKLFFPKLTYTVGLLLLVTIKSDNVSKSTKSEGSESKSSGDVLKVPPSPTPKPTQAPINPPTIAPVPAPTNAPTKAPVPAPTNPPVPPFTPIPAPTPPPIPNISVYVVIKTDNYPEETSFKVTNQKSVEVMSGGGYTKKLTEYTSTKALPSNDVYQFTIYDSYGDGMCCLHGQGGYNLFVDGQNIRASGGGFTKSETTTFPTVITPAPTKKPVPAPTKPPPPTPAPTKSPTPAPVTTGPVYSVNIIINTDDYPQETSFKVMNQKGIEVMAGGGYAAQRTVYTAFQTLPKGDTYTFTIYDTYGDGMCCAYGNGGYNVFVDGILIKAGGIFKSSESTTIPVKQISGSVKVFEDYQNPKYVYPTYEKSEVEKTYEAAKNSNKGGK